jgi:GYF domain 2
VGIQLNREFFMKMKKYYVHDGHRERGPFSKEELSSAAVDKETPIWYEGLESWTTAGNLEELRELFDKKLVPPPLPKNMEKTEAPRPKVVNRHDILRSFEDAQEGYPDSSGKVNWFAIITLILILAGLVFAYFFWIK